MIKIYFYRIKYFKKYNKQICKTIKGIHDKKIIHREFKPENIFINDNMDIKIGDFGISKQFGYLFHIRVFH